MERRPLSDRFADKIQPEPNSGCWLWDGGVNEHGYGIIGLGSRDQGTDKAHRVSWRLHRGEIPEGMNVLHRCDVPCCVNPEHLFIGTLGENSRDMVRKKRNFVPDNRGERSRCNKLDAAAVRHIRRRELTGPEYGRLYGVSKSAVYQIWGSHNWAWLAA